MSRRRLRRCTAWLLPLLAVRLYLLDEDYIATVSVLNMASADSRVLYPGAPVSAYVGIRMQF